MFFPVGTDFIGDGIGYKYVSNWEKLVYVFVKRSFIFKIKRSVDFENKTSEK